MEEACIDLRSNPLVNKFFAGWETQKAVTFAQNLLVIGIGVAYKLLNGNTPEEAFHKLHKMSENVMNEYETERPLKNPNMFKTETDKQNHGFQETLEARQRKKQFKKNQQQESYNFGDAYSMQEAAERKQVILSQEISKVKQKLELINQKLIHQPLHSQPNNFITEGARNQQQQNNFNNHQQMIDTDEENILMSPNMSRGRSRQNRLHSPVTPKITSSPPPSNGVLKNSLNPLVNSRSHLNDEAVKQCMNIEHQQENRFERDLFNGFAQQPRGFPEGQSLMPGNQSHMKSNSDMQKISNFIQKQRPQEKKPEQGSFPHQDQQQLRQRFNTEVFNNKQDILIPKHNNLPSKGQVKKTQQDQFLESNMKKNPHYMHVESRIKNEIQMARELHQQGAGKEGATDEELQNDFKQMMIRGSQQEEPSLKSKIEAQKQSKQQPPIISKEMGVQFSREAQKKFYEKQEAERKKQERERELIEHKQSAIPAQLQTYQIHYNGTKQQQQFFKNIEQLEEYNFSSEQQQFGGSQRESYIGPIGVSDQAIPSMQTTLQGNFQGRKNILDIANSFLSSPLMRQLNEDDLNSVVPASFQPNNEDEQDTYQQNYQLKNYEDNQSDKTNSKQYSYNPYSHVLHDNQAVAYPVPSQSVSQEKFYAPEALAPPAFSLEGFTQSFNPEQMNGGYSYKDKHLGNAGSNKEQKQQQQQKLSKSLMNGLDEKKKWERKIQGDRLVEQETYQQMEATNGNGKCEDIFRESINNSDFTLPNEEVQQFFKNQIFNRK